MATVSAMETFRKYIDAFNATDNPKYLAQFLYEMTNIALKECSALNTIEANKHVYRDNVLAAIKQLANVIDGPKTVDAGSGGGDESGDPYYTEQPWFTDEVPDLGFKDIIGLEEVKDAFRVNVLAPMHPKLVDIYRKFRGNQVGMQILLYGPPGTGKTHIAKCLAGALGCKIAVVQTSEVLAGIVGVAEKRMRDIFKQAEEIDGNCIIFFDEIDSLCSSRDSLDSRNTKTILTTMLTCMDGFMKKTKPGQMRIVIAATNLPWKLDPALKRGGRFETQIYIPVPDKAGVRKFVERGVAGIPRDERVTVDWLTEKLIGFSGADIKAILRQIADKPLRREIGNVLNDKIGKPLGEKITVNDCVEVLKSYINPITPKMEMQFEAYRRGISYEELLGIFAEDQNKQKKQ